ncbi:uncharacterized protein LOC117335583, partial [Pecten maximus]|uniref:uncharacterized protein LOC117335583 n=1 Tax=Pecten maximus TaxID=6579 RepID=UPI00145851C1
MTMVTKRCPIFCSKTCSKQHHPLLIALINTNTTENGETSFTALEATISRYVKLGKWSVCDDIYDPDPTYRYPLLHWAACLGKVTVVKWLVHRDKVSVFARHLSTYDTALHMAVQSLQKTCQKEASQVFGKLVPILAGSLACRNCNGDTPLHLICRSLLHEKPRVEYFTECVSSILKFAASRGGGFPATIVNSQNNDGNTPLHIVAQKDHTLNIIKMMMELGKVDLNLVNSRQQNALKVAIDLGQMKTSAYLHHLVEKAPKNRDGSIKCLIGPKQLGLKDTTVVDNDTNNSASDTAKKSQEKGEEKNIDNSPASVCNVSSTEDSTMEISNTDSNQNQSNLEKRAEDSSSSAPQASSNSPSSTSSIQLEPISVHPEVQSNTLRNNYTESIMPVQAIIAKQTGKDLPNRCSTTSSVSSESSLAPSISSDTATPTSDQSVSQSGSSQEDCTTFSLEPSQNSSTLSATSISVDSGGPSPAKKKKVKVLIVKKGALPTGQMVFADQVQL